jgi:hypothetical protein
MSSPSSSSSLSARSHSQHGSSSSVAAAAARDPLSLRLSSGSGRSGRGESRSPRSSSLRKEIASKTQLLRDARSTIESLQADLEIARAHSRENAKYAYKKPHV